MRLLRTFHAGTFSQFFGRQGRACARLRPEGDGAARGTLADALAAAHALMLVLAAALPPARRAMGVRAPLATIACGFTAAGCAGIESPRTPYAVPPDAVAGAAAAALFEDQQRPRFRLAEREPPAAAPRADAGADADADASADAGADDSADAGAGTDDSSGAARVQPALSGGRLGLFSARRFRLVTGPCPDCGASAAALWWLNGEPVAVPASADHDGGSALGGTDPASPALPRAVWVGAPQRVSGARLSTDAQSIEIDGGAMPLAVTPPIPTSTAYVDASTVQYFARRPLSMRGTVDATAPGPPRFVARTIFPEDDRIDVASLPLQPLAPNERLGTLIEAQALPRQRLLFARSRPADWQGQPVIALVLSGAQGDDDGSRAGHLAFATGVLGEGGEWDDWLVTNFYPLLEGNAKGIVPASLPIDKYLYDLNSGQLYYRPGYMLVAVLSRPRAALAAHRALEDTLLGLYCGDVEFDRASHNSTAMTIDPLRKLGWRIPAVGSTSRIAAVAAAPFAAVVRRSLRTARGVHAMFAAERTRLLPRVAFEVAGHDLLQLAAGPASAAAAADKQTPIEAMLAEDIEALIFVRLPQVPSSRRFGTYPVASLWSYGAALMADPAPYEGAPEAEPREFPQHLRDVCGAD